MSCDLPSSLSATQRLNITLEGISLPVGLVNGGWTSSRLGIQLISIVIEEMMGYNTRITEAVSGINGLYMVAGCLEPSQPQTADRKCGPLFSAHHVYFEAWSSYADEFKILTRDVRTAPLDLGSVGYSGSEGSFIDEDLLTLSWRNEGLPLEYYKSYNRTRHDLSSYFSAYTRLDSSKLMPCSMGKLWNSKLVERYVRISNDTDGVEVVDGALHARCEGGGSGFWWFSPSCRSDPSRCIPYLDGGNGWHADVIITKASLYNMPIAYAIAASSLDYRQLPSTNQILRYWWTPDDSFIKQSLARIIFPPHDAEAWASGDKRSAGEIVRLSKWAHYKMNSISGKLNRFLEQVHISPKDMDAMMLDFQLSHDSERLVACRWLQQNVDSWRSWLPDAKTCFPGWGMTSKSGDYVNKRSLAWDCAACHPGHFSEPLIDQFGRTGICKLCSTGRFQIKSGQTMCDVCSAGKYGDSLGSSRCMECLPGASSRSNETGCKLCMPGKYARERSSSSCIPCALGTWAAMAGSSKCRPCKLGRYADVEGMTACAKCGAKHTGSGCAACAGGTAAGPGYPLGSMSGTFWTTMDKVEGRAEWVYIQGATSNKSCGCDKGLRLEGGDCIACAEGMSCQGMGEVVIEKGYYSELPVSVYHCFGDKRRCPGGQPQDTCATGRRGITCAECGQAKKPNADGTCTACTGLDTAPFILICVAVLSFICIMYFALPLRGKVGQSKEVMLSTICCGQLVTLVQQLGVVAMMDITFEEPLASLLKVTRFFMFDIEAFNIGCLGAVGPVSRFIATASGFFVLLMLTAAIHSISVILFYRGNFAERMSVFVTSMGTVSFVVYISAISAMLGPLQCSQHPNGKWTSRAYNSVICWDSEESPDHMAMVIFGLCCLSGPIGFLACVAWISWQLPYRVYRGDIRFLDTYGFLFFRFRPSKGWYVNAILIRSFIVALTPVVPHPLLQVLLSFAVHQISLTCVIHVKPWCAEMANALDVAFSTVMLTVIIMAAFFVKDDDFRILSWITSLAILGTALAVPFVCVNSLCKILARKRKPYQFFLCHHKAKAGALARMLKTILVERPCVSRGVFLDSDNLSQLDELFHIVAHDVDCLVIIGTSQVFLRPWCVGEMTLARLKHVKVVILAMPDWKPPDSATIDHFDTLVDMRPLTQNSISLEHVQSTLRWIGELPTIQMPAQMNHATLCAVVDALTSGMQMGSVPKKESMMSAVSLPYSKVVIFADVADMEATVTAHCLAHLMVPHTMHSLEGAPSVCESKGDLPHNLARIIIICTKGCFERRPFLEVLVEACMCGAKGLPVIADPNFEVPTLDWLSEMHSEQSLVDGASGEAVANMIRNIFHEIAEIFQPQLATDSMLQLSAKHIADRVLSDNMKVLSLADKGRRVRIPSVLQATSNWAFWADGHHSRVSRVCPMPA